MKTIKIYHCDAFSNHPHMGNPAGVVLEGAELTEEQMQETAKIAGLSETAFVLPSEKADVGIRFFTPGQEVDLCGHATMATIYFLKTKGELGIKTDLTIETKAGILPIRVRVHTNGQLYITMQQASPQFQEFHGSLKDLAASMGIEEEDIETGLPILYGSTGAWTLLVPIKHLQSFKKMTPNNRLFPTILKEMPRASIHPFCFETYDPNAHMHARHFSSAFSGTVEDPVTGTASGVMGAYYARFIDRESDSLKLLIEQGQEMGRDGRVEVTETNKGNGIEITGNAVYVNEFELSI